MVTLRPRQGGAGRGSDPQPRAQSSALRKEGPPRVPGSVGSPCWCPYGFSLPPLVRDLHKIAVNFPTLPYISP